MVLNLDIIATVGPSCWSDEILQSLIDNGVRCFRFPFSKETPEIHNGNCRRIRLLARDSQAAVLTMADLPGGKPRLSNNLPIKVFAGEMRDIGLTRDGSGGQLHLDPALTGQLPDLAGVDTLIGDGESIFHISSVNSGTATGYFTATRDLERRRAFTIPSANYAIECFTNRDKDFCNQISHDAFDSVALSFTQVGQDIENARQWMAGELGWTPRITAKIESAEGVENVDDIARAADAVMVGRGDLALQVGFDNLWHAECKIVDACRRAGTYVIIATGLLDSLVNGREPTRSEAIDVAAAAGLGASALLLSAETSIGIDPVNAVRVLKHLAGRRSK